MPLKTFITTILLPAAILSLSPGILSAGCNGPSEPCAQKAACVEKAACAKENSSCAGDAKTNFACAAKTCPAGDNRQNHDAKTKACCCDNNCKSNCKMKHTKDSSECGCAAPKTASCCAEKQAHTQTETCVKDILPVKWLNGINVPWVNFGRDFGDNATSQQTIRDSFKRYAEGGVNSVRFWIHCDGRESPEFDEPGGFVTGVADDFFEDFDTMMQAAADNQIYVMPALWSFDMAVPRLEEAGKFAGVQRPLLEDKAKTQSYIDNVLIPLVKRYADNKWLMAWEICNEPEWIIENQGVKLEDVQRFHGMLAHAIHQHCPQPVTTGASSLKWNSDKESTLAVGNWWSDESLKAATGGLEGAYLDFYQIHFYDWMAPWGFNPFAEDSTPEFWGIDDKPVIIGECSHDAEVKGQEEKLTLLEMYEIAHRNGYRGIYPWSDHATDGHGQWHRIEPASSAFKTAHPELFTPQTKPEQR